MDGQMFNDMGKSMGCLFIIGILLAIGAWELLKWLITLIDISISIK